MESESKEGGGGDGAWKVRGGGEGGGGEVRRKGSERAKGAGPGRVRWGGGKRGNVCTGFEGETGERVGGGTADACEKGAKETCGVCAGGVEEDLLWVCARGVEEDRVTGVYVREAGEDPCACARERRGRTRGCVRERRRRIYYGCVRERRGGLVVRAREAEGGPIMGVCERGAEGGPVDVCERCVKRPVGACRRGVGEEMCATLRSREVRELRTCARGSEENLWIGASSIGGIAVFKGSGGTVEDGSGDGGVGRHVTASAGEPGDEEGGDVGGTNRVSS